MKFPSFQSSKKNEAGPVTMATAIELAAGDQHHGDRGEDDDDEEGLGRLDRSEKAPSSRSSESGEINVLDDFSEGEEVKEAEEESVEEQGKGIKSYEEDLEEAVALTMQVGDLEPLLLLLFVIMVGFC